MERQNDYDDIPGTTVFDAERARRGYHLNMFCMSLMKAEIAPPSRPTRRRSCSAFQ
jgi:protocatechuate 4,5-dioxygenase alpha subunit